MAPAVSLPCALQSTEFGDDEFIGSLSVVESLLAEMAATPQWATLVALADARRAAADAMLSLEKHRPNAPAIPRALAAICDAARCGALDMPLDPESLRRLQHWRAAGWPGLVGSMLLTAAWRWSDAPVLSDVPQWMWPAYTRWLFAPPNRLGGESDARSFAGHVERHAGELARWAERNIGSAAVRAAAEAFAACAPLHPLRFLAVDTSGAIEACRRIITRLHCRAAGPFEPMVASRLGRGLRVGFIARNWEPGADACAALAHFEQAPPGRVEVLLFSWAEPVSAFAWQLRHQQPGFHVLPPELAAQVDCLRQANLDAAVFVGDTTAPDDFTRLATFRVAPLQVALDHSDAGSGIGEIDLRVVATSAASEKARSCERLGVLPAGASTFVLRRGGDAELAYAREDLGWGAADIIFVTVLASIHAAEEAMTAAARILGRVPAARLVLHIPPDPLRPAAALEFFAIAVDDIMRRAGVAPGRFTILAPAEAAVDETRAIVRLADVYLSFRGGPIWAAEALSMGVPVVTANPAECGWLAAEQVADGAASGPDDFVARAVALGADATLRAAVRAKLAESSSRFACTDSLAGSDGFLALLEAAHDELELTTRDAFRRTTRPILTAEEADVAAAIEAATLALDYNEITGALDAALRGLGLRPRDPRLRALYGRALLADRQYERAVTYLLAAVEEFSDDADLWYTLAQALREHGDFSGASRALQTSLRLQPQRPDGWAMLISLADSAGAVELARNAFDVLKQTAPEHPRLPELAARFGG